MKIATFNINSIRARINNFANWVNNVNPDIVMLQEIKCENDQFPIDEILKLGFSHSVINGQKSYNGVAILSKYEIKNIETNLFDENDDQKRFIKCEINDTIFINIYLPNGNPVFDESKNYTQKFLYKLNWMDKLIQKIENYQKLNKKIVIGGDFNVIPTKNDCVNIKDWEFDAAHMPEVLKKYHALLNLGFSEIYSEANLDYKKNYSFWDYQRASFEKDNGIRIDFFLINSFASKNYLNSYIDVEPRKQEKPSDHAPLIMELN